VKREAKNRVSPEAGVDEIVAQLPNGRYQMANGKYQMANIKYQMANGKWQPTHRSPSGKIKVVAQKRTSGCKAPHKQRAPGDAAGDGSDRLAGRWSTAARRPSARYADVRTDVLIAL
jgi:hypothetical protein